MIDRTLVRLNNVAVRLRRSKCRPGELLVLLARCLQRSTCECNLDESVQNCRRCGQCPIAELLEMGDRLGVEVYMATGGREAAARASRDDVKAIVAVACEKELREGIFAAVPKPVFAAGIDWPCGPCKDTTIDVAEVEKAVQWFLR